MPIIAVLAADRLSSAFKMHLHSAVVKVCAVIGAAQLVGGAIAESDVERRAHPGLWGPLVGAIKGVGNVFVGTANTIGFVAGRLIPPKNPKINLPHLLEGLTLVATGPAFLGLLFATFYLDAERQGEVGSLNRAINY